MGGTFMSNINYITNCLSQGKTPQQCLNEDNIKALEAKRQGKQAQLGALFPKDYGRRPGLRNEVDQLTKEINSRSIDPDNAPDTAVRKFDISY